MDVTMTSEKKSNVLKNIQCTAKMIYYVQKFLCVIVTNVIISTTE